MRAFLTGINNKNKGEFNKTSIVDVVDLNNSFLNKLEILNIIHNLLYWYFSCRFVVSRADCTAVQITLQTSSLHLNSTFF